MSLSHSPSQQLLILLICEEPYSIARLQSFFEIPHNPLSTLKVVRNSDDALKFLQQNQVDVVVFDLDIESDFPLDDMEVLCSHTETACVIAISNSEKKDEGSIVIQKGAQDFIAKDKLSENLLNRSIHYAIGRQKLLKQIYQHQISLEQSEARLKMLLRNSTDGIIVSDLQGIIRFTNPSAKIFLGNNKGQFVGSLLPWKFENEAIAELTLQNNSKTVKIAEARQVKIIWKSQPAFLTILNDITLRKTTEQALDSAKLMLESKIMERTQELENANNRLTKELNSRMQLEQELRARETRQQTQQNILLDLATDKHVIEGSIQDAFKFITQAAANTLNTEKVGIWLLNDDKNKLICKDMYHRNTRQHSQYDELNIIEFPALFSFIQENRILAIDINSLSESIVELKSKLAMYFNSQAILSASIYQRGLIKGIISFECSERKRVWHLDEKDFAASTADLITLSLEQADRRQAEDKLRLAAKVVNSTNEGVMVMNRNGKVESVNPAFTLITGYESDEIVGKKSDIMQSGRHEDHFYDDLWNSLYRTGNWQGQVWSRRKNGEIYPEWQAISEIKDEYDNTTHFVNVFHDISERVQKEEQIMYQAYHDPLTGLPNRTLFLDRLKVAIAHAQRHDHKLAVLFLDLDYFKQVNDTYGHLAGDRLLETVAQRLQQSVREEDTISRHAGDEFTVLLPKIKHSSDGGQVAKKIIISLTMPIPYENINLSINVSIGIAMYPDDGNDPETLIKNADRAMYTAKSNGRGRFAFNPSNDSSKLLCDPIVIN